MERIIDAALLRCHRPGYRGRNNKRVSREEVDAWIKEAKEQNVSSIIVLLDDEQLNYYRELPKGLIETYREHGFEVAHLPVQDYLRPPLSAKEKIKVWEAYQDLPKPVLIHCSAGVDRTGSAVAYIMERLQSAG